MLRAQPISSLIHSPSKGPSAEPQPGSQPCVRGTTVPKIPQEGDCTQPCPRTLFPEVRYPGDFKPNGVYWMRGACSSFVPSFIPSFSHSVIHSTYINWAPSACRPLGDAASLKSQAPIHTGVWTGSRGHAPNPAMEQRSDDELTPSGGKRDWAHGQECQTGGFKTLGCGRHSYW